ncbi:MAG: restriction endonuclease [Ardenticatenaceae bacterium]|nr:restriction endonuclease [Ardenticatenaceae bacterium]
MVVRTEWRLRQQSPQFKTRTGESVSLSSRLIIGFVTAVYLVWLLIRAVSQPAWIDQLPTVVYELLRLAEIAWLATIVLLWVVVWWQARQEEAQPWEPLNLETLYNLHPADFERYVARLFRLKGYRVVVRGRSGDLGVDLVITRQGGKRAIAQCKRYRSTIGPDIVRELYGTLIHEGVSHAFLVTTAEISDSAREWASGKPMTLIDGSTLVEIAASLQLNPTSSAKSL